MRVLNNSVVSEHEFNTTMTSQAFLWHEVIRASEEISIDDLSGLCSVMRDHVEKSSMGFFQNEVSFSMVETMDQLGSELSFRDKDTEFSILMVFIDVTEN